MADNQQDNPRRTVDIGWDGTFGTIEVDGVDVSNHVSGAHIDLLAGDTAKVKLQVIAPHGRLRIEDAQVEAILVDPFAPPEPDPIPASYGGSV